MIQDTTLRMILQAVDQASAPIESVTEKVEGLDSGLSSAKKTAGDALPAIGKEAEKASEGFDELSESASKAAFHIGPGTVEAIAAAGLAFVALVNYIQSAIEKHLELTDTADRLSLPYTTVEQYSEAWTKVAESLNDAARGYKALGDAQADALKALGLSPGNLSELDRVRKLVAVGNGSRQEKIDVFRRLFGMSYEDAAKELDTTINKFYTQAALGGYNPAVTKALPTVDGITAGSFNVSQLLNSGRLPTPEAFKNRQEDQRSAEASIKEINAAVAREQAKADREAEAARKAAAKAALQDQRDRYDAQQDFVKEGLAITKAEQKATEKAIEDGNKQIAKSGTDAWRIVNDETNAALRGMKVPVNEFVETWKDSMKDMVAYGDFSISHLVARIIYQLSSKALFSAIDNVGDALGNALDGSGGSGGILKAAGHFLGSIFGGNAGGGAATGMRIVGENGPEIADFGTNLGRVYNARQLAFAGVGPQAQAPPVYNDNRQYHLSGVDTQQMIAYIEQTRRADQRANVEMLERNGLGRMR